MILAATSLNAIGLTKEQIKVKALVLKIAKKEFPEYITACKGVCLTESSYGLHKLGDAGRSIRSMQVSAIAFRDVIRVYPKRYGKYKGLSDQRLRTVLIDNQVEAITIGILFLKHLIKTYGFDLGVCKYNGDLSGGYLKRVIRNMKRI